MEPKETPTEAQRQTCTTCAWGKNLGRHFGCFVGNKFSYYIPSSTGDTPGLCRSWKPLETCPHCGWKMK